MRLPSGTGTVFKEKGKRRKKWRVVATIGWDDNGKQIRKTVGYFETKSEALDKLYEYNKAPNGIDANITFSEVYAKLCKYKIDSLSDSSIKAYDLAYKYCSRLHNMKMIDIKTDDLLQVMELVKDKYGIARRVRTLLKQSFQYAIQNDIVSVNYAEFIEIKRQKPKASKNPFTSEEIEILFENIDLYPMIDTILIMLFTGMRIGELLPLKKENVDLENRKIICGIKTEAGINRIIPISDKIYDLIEKRMLDNKNNTELLIPYNYEREYKYRTYRDEFDKILKSLNMDHTPHECRHTFATMLDNAGANERAITKIMGHTNYKTTEKFYTHKDIDELKKAINML